MTWPARSAAALLPLVLAACAATPRAGGVGNRRFEVIRTVTVRHIGMIGTGCAAPDPGPVRLEARPAEGVFRILNLAARGLDLYYDDGGWGGDYLMFYIRFRDASGNFVPALRPDDCGWWSIKLNDNNLYYDDNWPTRGRLSVPAGGRLDIRHDQTALTDRWRGLPNAPAPAPPCEMQVRLWGYPGPRTWEPVAADSEWIPAPCPREAG